MPRKLPKLEHVKRVRSHGRVYLYFNTGRKVNGKTVYARLPDPASPQFYSVYGALVAGRTKREAAHYTVYDMAIEYEASAKFIGHAANTQKLYKAQLAKVRHYFGKFPVNALEPVNVREVLDKAGWNAGTQNMVTAVLGALYTWGRKAGKTTGEPTKDVERPKGGSHSPWPDDVLQAGLEASDDTIRLAVHLLYFTGLRIGDAINLRWRAFDKGEITVTPEKTKRFDKTLHIPVAAELKAELDKAPRRGLTILHGIKEFQLRRALQAFTRALGVETVPHGLRKNAVNSLLLAGCSIPEVAAITGQTYQVVEHYAAQINRRKLAGGAIVKFDDSRRKKI